MTPRFFWNYSELLDLVKSRGFPRNGKNRKRAGILSLENSGNGFFFAEFPAEVTKIVMENRQTYIERRWFFIKRKEGVFSFSLQSGSQKFV